MPYREGLEDPRMLATICVLLGLNFSMAGDNEPMDTSEPPPRPTPRPTPRPAEPEKKKEPEEDLSKLTDSQREVNLSTLFFLFRKFVSLT